MGKEKREFDELELELFEMILEFVTTNNMTLDNVTFVHKNIEDEFKCKATM